MALEGPQLIYARNFDEEEDAMSRALRLAREVEELLETTSSVSPNHAARDANGAPTRMARAMAASLVDELEAIVSGKRKTSSIVS